MEISADVKEGTQDIAALRSEIDDAVSKANALVNEIKRFRKTLRLPPVDLRELIDEGRRR